jgi:hypothetical protein
MTVALAPRPAEALARRGSDCPLCPRPIEKGDPIKKLSDALGWGHAECADDYFEVYPPTNIAGEGEGEGAE